MKKSLVLGFFDGVHKAHRIVVESAFEYSDNVILLTFKESPSVYFGTPVKYILKRENSVYKIKSLGVSDVILQDFKDIANISAEDYLSSLVKKYNPISISTGFNHTFGANKTGNPVFLEQNQEKYGYKYICTPPVKDQNDIISSSLIKTCIKNGNVERANYLLESYFMIDGKVCHGAKIGRKIGFPTANISYPDKITELPLGVYSVDVDIPEYNKTKLRGIMNWGMKPTVNNTKEPVAEVHILNFNEDLYGKNIIVSVLKQIRKEKKFSNLNELKIQINEDIKNA